MKKAAVVIFYLLSIAIAAELAARSAMKSQLAGFEVELSKTQGMLSLRHLQRYRELELDMQKGCHAAVLEKLKISRAIESTLLSSELRDKPAGELSKYVAKQAPELLETLPQYESPYGNSWKEPTCELPQTLH